MRIPHSLKKGVTILASVSTIAIGLPAATAQAACSNTSDSNVRFGAGVGIQQCDSDRLADPTDAYNVVVTIDDSGFHPSEVTVAEGALQDAHIIFVNLGTRVHSAQEIPSSPMWNSGVPIMTKQNDFQQGGNGGVHIYTGGIGPDPDATVQQAMKDHRFQIVDIGNNGDFVYTSYTDCLAADRVRPSPTNFDCTPAVIHVVDDQVSTATVKAKLGPGADFLGTAYTGTVLRPLGDPQCAMLAPNHPLMAPNRPNACVSAIRSKAFARPTAGKKSAPIIGSATVTIDDVKGFDPILTVVATDTTVTFVNKAENRLVHGVKFSNKRMVPGMATAFGGQANTDSGGLAPGQSWSVVFHWVAAGTLAFSPPFGRKGLSDDLINNVNPAGNVGPTVLFNGGIQDVCPPGQFTSVAFDSSRGVGRPCTAIAAAQDPSVLTPGTVKDF